MANDNLSNRGVPDRDLISLSESWEVNYWCATLGCTEAQLRAAVSAVGHSAAAVRRHLGK